MIKKENFSYSKLSTYNQCPFAYNLKYNEKKYFDTPTLANLLGTLVHYTEEQISLALRNSGAPNYKLLKEQFYDINIPKKNPYDTEGDIFGINILRSRFPKEFFAPNEKTGNNYFSKINNYLNNLGRQEKFLIEHPELEIFDVERSFGFEFNGFFIKGFIDRILKYKNKDAFQVYDIKTKDKPFTKQETTTPLQHVIYSLGLQNQLNLVEPIQECFYDLVFLDMYQPAGTKGFVARGEKKLTKIFDGIQEKEYPPSPSPLCYWCAYSGTNPATTDEGRFTCPYYSLWTPENKSFEVVNKWPSEEPPEVLSGKLKNLDKQHRYDFFEF